MTLRNAFAQLATEPKQDDQITLLEQLATVPFATSDGQVTLADLLQQVVGGLATVRLEQGHGATVSNPSFVSAQDAFSAGEVLLDQAGADGVLTFSFTQPVDLIWVRSVGGVSRADPFGGTPTASIGVYCADDEPAPLTVSTDALKVYAPSGATVSVWGYRYA